MYVGWERCGDMYMGEARGMGMWGWGIGRLCCIPADGFVALAGVFDSPPRGGQVLTPLLFSLAAHSLSCQRSMTMQVGAGLSKTFNWTAKEIETCDSGALCHESMIVIKAGKIRAGSGVEGSCMAIATPATW